MANFNKVILAGRLTSDPELKKLSNETSVVKFSLAVSRTYMKGDNKEEEVGFFECESFGPRADVIAKFFTKGKPILVEGRLKQDRWEDKDGGKRSKVVIHVDEFSFVGGDNKNNGDSNPPNKEEKPNRQQNNNRTSKDKVPF